jgi:putative membrane protein
MLAHFGLTPADLLGSGGESQVYALDAERVLRIYKAGVPGAYIAGRQALYDEIRAEQPPFEIPYVLERGARDGREYVIERRMRGRDFAAVLPTLAGRRRERALRSYLAVAVQIGAIRMPDRPFGELLVARNPLRTATWPAYLRASMQRALADSRADLDSDVPGIAALLARLDITLDTLAGFEQRALVHGDYFPGNVFIDDTDTICGVGDFGYTTVVGDPRMDTAGALAFLEVTHGYRDEDVALLSGELQARGDSELLAMVAFYRLYYAIYFSICKQSDPHTYQWCMRALREAAAHA